MRWLFLMLLMMPPLMAAAAEPTWSEQPARANVFAGRGVVGTAVVYDEQAARGLVFDHERAAKRFSPAPTFKLFNALAALQRRGQGRIRGIRWDGVKRA